MTRELERLLWRNRNGLCSAGQLERALRSELYRLSTARSELEGMREDLRSFSGAAVLCCDESIFAALMCLSGGHSEKALLALRKAEAALRHLRATEEALTNFEQAHREWEELLLRRGVESFGQFPTLRVPGRLVLCAREFLVAGEPQKASFVIRLLGREIAKLGTRESSGVTHRKNLLTWLDLTNTSEGDPELVREIGRLLEDGYVNLAKGLGSDLEVQVTVESGRRERILPRLEDTYGQAASVEKAVASWIASNS